MPNPLEQHTLWRIGSWDSAFAEIALRSPDEANEINTILCRSCGNGVGYRRPYPMIFEWESGSDKIGDLLGPEMGRLVVTVFDTPSETQIFETIVEIVSR